MASPFWRRQLQSSLNRKSQSMYVPVILLFTSLPISRQRARSNLIMQWISAWEKDEKRRVIRFVWGIFRLFHHHIELPFILLSQVENRKRGRSCQTRVSREHTRTNHTAVPSSFRSAPRYLRIPVSASITQCALFFEAAKQGHIVCLFPSFASRSVNSYVVSTVVSQTRRLASRM